MNPTATDMIAPAISPEEIAARRSLPPPANRVIFQVAGLYGFNREGVPFPFSQTVSIDSGPVTISLDPEAGAAGNVGIIDFDSFDLRVRYGVHAIFPGIHDLVTSGKHDLSLLGPVRATATDLCTVTPDMTGWRALGCMDFLPGSLWAGASGG
jgi:hypothetical protein